MDSFNIGKIIAGLQKNPDLYLKKLKQDGAGKVNNFAPELNASTSNSKPQPNTRPQTDL